MAQHHVDGVGIGAVGWRGHSEGDTPKLQVRQWHVLDMGTVKHQQVVGGPLLSQVP